MTRNNDPILVVGGGLGGASISLALARKGIHVRLLEQDAVCLGETIELADGDFAEAFRRYERARYLRTARVQHESRYLWDSFCHVEGIEREVMRQSASARTEQDAFDCVAWLDDGFSMPAQKGAAA